MAQQKCIEPNYFIPRVTNSDIQSKLAEFRSAEESQQGRLRNNGFWIDVNTTTVSSFHWIDGSSVAGYFIYKYAGIVVPKVHCVKIVMRQRVITCSV